MPAIKILNQDLSKKHTQLIIDSNIDNWIFFGECIIQMFWYKKLGFGKAEDIEII